MTDIMMDKASLEAFLAHFFIIGCVDEVDMPEVINGMRRGELIRILSDLQATKKAFVVSYAEMNTLREELFTWVFVNFLYKVIMPDMIFIIKLWSQ